MKDKKIIFMGSPKIASDYLEALIENNFIISAVFSQPPKKKSRGMKIIESEVHQLANKNNIIITSHHIHSSVASLQQSQYNLVLMLLDSETTTSIIFPLLHLQLDLVSHRKT